MMYKISDKDNQFLLSSLKEEIKRRKLNFNCKIEGTMLCIRDGYFIKYVIWIIYKFNLHMFVLGENNGVITRQLDSAYKRMWSASFDVYDEMSFGAAVDSIVDFIERTA